MSPRPRGGKSRSPLEPHAALAAGFDHRGTGPDAGRDRAAAIGRPELKTSEAAVRRFFKRLAITFKKNAARHRTGPARRGRSPRMLEGKQDDPPLRTMPKGQAAALTRNILHPWLRKRIEEAAVLIF